ncbi:hypothetical protein OG203_16250 [Nocardia sp. NBC_01499]|uniref:hypothetical protein n=1 Tax=Nocardia sp. NBC_01499 TaxID=2903597 RepID=UPI003870CBC8
MAPAVQFTVNPAGPTSLVVGGPSGQPGVEVRNTGGGSVAPQTVRVTLPAGGILRFAPEVGSQLVLTVFTPGGNSSYYAELDPNSNPTSLTFRNVDVSSSEPGAVSALWVSVSALQVPAGPTALTFNVGGQISHSGEIDVSRTDRS